MFAEVIVNSSASDLNRVFDYSIPEGMEVALGARVLVPFGYRKNYEIGYVIGIKDSTEFKCRDIARVVDRVFDDNTFSVAKWISHRFFCNLSDALRLFMPPGTGKNVDKVKAKTEKWATLACDVDVEMIKSDKQKRIVSFLLDNTEAPISELLALTDTSLAVLKTLEKNGFVKIFQNEVYRNPFYSKEIKPSVSLELTEEQKNVFDEINVEVFGKYLIHGVTGSGKTEIYLQLIEKVLKLGKNAIVLVPEISLTPQITDRFLSRFGDVVAILHSRLSIGERYDEWRKIKNGEVRIVIGVRSAIFAPLDNVGIIIIDEEHDASYKSDSVPRYDTKEIAARIAELNNVPLILGSATPNICTYYRALNGEYKLLELKNRILNAVLPAVNLVDMREELAAGNRTMFSRKLYSEIKKNIENGEQTILFLNRRGYSTFIMCRDCGYVVKCDKCDVAMTYHLSTNRLICHYCGLEHSNVTVCPECNGKNIRYFGTGTQKVEEEIYKYFPNTSVVRMDLDTTRTKNAHEDILNKFKNEKIDILLGTQMITKGHDFENVTLVGVLAADASINVSDYRANERTFQVLTQVMGRAGRGEKSGRAIVQTYLPDEFSIQAAKSQDYKKFYNLEINVREKLNYPPFCDIIMCVLSGVVQDDVKVEAFKLYDIFSKYFEVYSPIPAPISKINENYRWRLLIKLSLTEENINIINSCLSEYNLVKNSDIKFSLDSNPNNMS